MLYHLYELAHAALSPARAAADSAKFIFRNPLNPLAHTSVGRSTAAAAELVERTTRRYKKPNFGIFSTTVNGRSVSVQENIVWQKPFCRLIHFRRDLPAREIAESPRVLIVAPLSGHFATLLRGTVEGMLPGHEVYITDWHDARAVPTERGKFDLEDYVDYIVDIIRLFHGDVHIMAVCQPSVPVLMAVSHLEAERDPEAPRSMTLMGGPVDTRLSPTAVNQLAKEKGTSWFRRNVITTVPWPHSGHGRLVYPGFLQLTGFMSMNLDRHLNAHKELFFNLVKGDGDSVEKHREFYDEYLAVMDLTADYYLQTIEHVFVEHALPRGEMMYRGKRIDTGAVRRVALMTVEGEKDDITGIGQCQAAHTLCCNLTNRMRKHHLQPAVGHYGIFNGSRFRTDIVPQITAFMRRHDPRGAGLLRRTFRAMFDPRRIEAAPEPITVRELNLTKLFPAALASRPKTNSSADRPAASSQQPPLGLVGTVPQITHNRPARGEGNERKGK